MSTFICMTRLIYNDKLKIYESKLKKCGNDGVYYLIRLASEKRAIICYCKDHYGIYCDMQKIHKGTFIAITKAQAIKYQVML